MTADIYAQFIEALACFAVGAYFGVKFAFTEVIGACSGKIIRGILQFIYGLSYFISLGLVVYAVADGCFHYYHFILQFLGAIALIPISRKIFLRYKKPIQKFWLRLIGRVELVNPEIIKKMNDKREIENKNKKEKHEELKNKHKNRKSNIDKIESDPSLSVNDSKQKSIIRFKKLHKKNSSIDISEDENHEKFKNKNSVKTKLRKKFAKEQ